MCLHVCMCSVHARAFVGVCMHVCTACVLFRHMPTLPMGGSHQSAIVIPFTLTNHTNQLVRLVRLTLSRTHLPVMRHPSTANLSAAPLSTGGAEGAMRGWRARMAKAAMVGSVVMAGRTESREVWALGMSVG